MNTFEKGEPVWVASSEMDWGNKRHRKYVVYHNGHHYCEPMPDRGMLVPWRLARKVPEEPAYYTQETFPKGEVWIRGGNKKERLVFGIAETSIAWPGSSHPYSGLADFEISTDGRRNWRKAVPESE